MGKRAGSEVSCGEERKRSGGVYLLVCLVVVGVIVFFAHWPSLSAKALSLDDDQYLVENRLVRNPSWASAKRFLTEVLEPSTVRGYYQPLSMLSLMLDAAMGAGVDNLEVFHRTSLFLHVANSLLLIVFLYLLFGDVLAAGAIGLLYGVHPVGIESIAWLSERKTLLAAFFALWCLIFYVHYVRRGKRRYGAVCLVMYVLSVMSKPTVVGVPVLLLVLDWWPFGRLSKKAVLEKLPLFIVGCGAGVVTFISQSRSASVALPVESGVFRVFLIFCHNIIFYIRNLVWPVNLSWYYPFPQPFNLSQPEVFFGVVGTCVLAAVVVISLKWTRSPAAGFLFFLAAIFPSLGVVGFHPMIAADRHMYFPMIGLLLVVGWWFGRFRGGEYFKLGKSARRIILASAVVLLATSEVILTRCYLVYWRDSESLYEYMVGYSPNVAELHNNLGNILNSSGKAEEAIGHFKRSLELMPNSHQIHNNLGNALEKVGRSEEAIGHYRRALKLKPNFAVGHFNLAAALARRGKKEEAIAEYQEALRFKPDYVEALSNLGFELAGQGKIDEAIEYYKKTLELEPKNVIAHGRFGLALASAGRIDEAIKEFRIVLGERPGDAEMHFNLGVLLERQGKITEAINQYRKALAINPDYTQASERLKASLTRQKRKN